MCSILSAIVWFIRASGHCRLILMELQMQAQAQKQKLSAKAQKKISKRQAYGGSIPVNGLSSTLAFTPIQVCSVNRSSHCMAYTVCIACTCCPGETFMLAVMRQDSMKTKHSMCRASSCRIPQRICSSRMRTCAAAQNPTSQSILASDPSSRSHQMANDTEQRYVSTEWKPA